MSNTRARAHSLRVSAPDDRAVAHAVAMLERARDNVGDDFHIAMAVRGKASSGRHQVFIDHTQRAKGHVRRIVVIDKRKSVIRVEPAKIKMAARFSFANLDHWFLPNPRSGWKHK